MQQDTCTMTQHCHAAQHVPSSMVNTQANTHATEADDAGFKSGDIHRCTATAYLTVTKLDN